MQSFQVRLPKPKSEYVSIFAICCLHIGHKGYDKKKAEEYRDFILRTPDTYAIDLGDDTDNALPGDEKHNSMMFENNLTPDEQFVVACEFWRPLVQKGKVIATFDSNHWWRTEAKIGISMAKQMNEFLRMNAKGLKPEWGRWQSLYRISVGRNTYTVHSQHGSGGGTTPESALKKCRETAYSHHADVYLRGHHHKKVIHQDLYFDWRDGSDSPQERTRTFGCTGCFLKWDNSYAERSGLPPAVRGAIKLELSSKRHDVRISL